jgi:hypothetical protein
MLKELLTYVTAVLVTVFAFVAIGLFVLLVFSSSKLANFVSTTIPAVPRIFLRCVKLFLVAKRVKFCRRIRAWLAS